MSDHTPGSWKADIKDRTVRSTDHGIVCEVWTCGDEQEDAANTRLMAAAPDLLRACEMDALHNGPGLLEYAADMLGGRSRHTAESLRAMAAAMRAAVSKAKGESDG